MDKRFMQALASLLEGKHKHRCPSCGTVWEHEDKCAQTDEQAFQIAHTCPHCGKPRVQAKYFGDNPTNAMQTCEQGTMQTQFV
jgi:predicted RNA-binding Zn-ribbon protein involved in translation (DUF1610 family)